MTNIKGTLYPSLENLVGHLNANTISEERKTVLHPLIDFIQTKVSEDAEIRLNFICTHNSRRSHFSQIWAQTMASYFSVRNVFCYSGGTETTALFPMVVETLKNHGFEIARISEGANPIYSVKFSDNAHPIIGFSKKMDAAFNPKSQFAAIMTCDSANEACPVVPGSEKRIPITFKDPKEFDDTPQQTKKYQERSLQIATELFYVFYKIKTN